MTTPALFTLKIDNVLVNGAQKNRKANTYFAK